MRIAGFVAGLYMRFRYPKPSLPAAFFPMQKGAIENFFVNYCILDKIIIGKKPRGEGESLTEGICLRKQKPRKSVRTKVRA